jgi:cobalt-precorrin-5B (C1)-methyltransferase
MILVFGGTTEGRKAVEVLEEGGNVYYYSTKTGEQDITLHNGQRIDGALDGEAMQLFIREHEIRLIVDAAHPFASQLHETIAQVSAALGIPVVRYERIYPPRDPDITWIDDYSQVPTDITSLLATTGVQSISKLKWIEAKGVKVIYRILNRESSIRLAHQQGATDEQLCFFEDETMPEADAILLKESGLSGGFPEKVAAARAKGMRIIALKRPSLSIINCHCIATPHSQRENATLSKRELSIVNYQLSIVNGSHGLRRAIEKLLPEFYPLHSGLTTGTCATAAAVAATRRLLCGDTPEEVAVLLPNGETITVPVGYGDDYAYCIKEAGDDPDVTNGIEVRAKVKKATNFEICGGEGVGRFTLPGFDYPPGEAAINKGPREMIRKNIERVINELSIINCQLSITIIVPDGSEIARRTFNPRLGIEGGISIIGVSGIVKPFSEEAFIESIRKCVQVAIASGTDRIVINSGGKSERFVKALYPTLPQQAFVEYGNYIGETLSIISSLFTLHSSLFTLNSSLNVTLGVMLGKAVKLAEGHLDTHSRRATMNRDFITQLLREADCPVITDYTLARELWNFLSDEQRTRFAQVVLRHCYTHCRPLLPNGHLTILLIDEEGQVYE